nr:MAG TPA: hypothetical protein [Caudoviricetes sp.]
MWSKYVHQQMHNILQNQEFRSNQVTIISSPLIKSSHPPHMFIN